ncbi:unnamed protein product [Linum tenue]|uniref:Uncharacterized protein n=1 Tax=Linum tenue TaxID=586396 RepID=A0AAV0KTZ9_9ROSI|nr:unnamed protein product [Linum tenue]
MATPIGAAASKPCVPRLRSCDLDSAEKKKNLC